MKQQHPYRYSAVINGIRAFHSESAETLPARLATIPGTKLAELRDAVRYFGIEGLIPEADVRFVENVVTTEIARRWAD